MVFQYRPLDATKNEIRLLTLEDEENKKRSYQDGRLHFTMHYFSLDKGPPFEAFSYAWGNQTKNRRIMVDGEIFAVTSSLLEALQHHSRRVRSKSNNDVLYAWTDAICINQDDMDEKSEQVQRMHYIYQKANTVVYLGNGDVFMDLMVTLSIIQLTTELRQGAEIKVDGNSWKAISALFSKSWFNRMWVIQEFFLSKSMPPVYCGPCDCRPEDLFLLLSKLYGMRPTSLNYHQLAPMHQGMRQYLLLYTLRELMDKFFSSGAECLLTCLWNFRDRLTTDPRDKIYSLLGIASRFTSQDKIQGDTTKSNFGLRHLIVDYRASVEDVYTSLVRSMVVETQSLDVICACQYPSIFRRTWVPDWSEPWSHSSLLTHQMNLLTTQYKASKSKECSVIFKEGSSILSTKGICWNRIQELIQPPKRLRINAMHWIARCLKRLDRDIFHKLADVYAKSEEADKEMVIVGQVCLAVCGGGWEFPARNSGVKLEWDFWSSDRHYLRNHGGFILGNYYNDPWSEIYQHGNEDDESSDHTDPDENYEDDANEDDANEDDANEDELKVQISLIAILSMLNSLKSLGEGDCS
jgi:hypothetical protein